MSNNRPNVGIGVLVVKEGKVLLGERIGGRAPNTWSLPGGHFEYGETFGETALRETEEETGLTDIEIQKIVSLYNERDYEKHYVNIGILALWKSGEPQVTEPDKMANWQWFDPQALPEPLFTPSRKTIENWLAGTLYSDPL